MKIYTSRLGRQAGRRLLRVLTGLLLLLCAEAIMAGGLLTSATGPAAAQSDSGFPFRFPFPFSDRGHHSGPFWPWQQQQQPAPEQHQQSVDFSKAPPPHKQDTTPTLNVVVMGDSMADWLAYGLEEAFGETPEIGVIRKPKPYRGLIRSESRSDPFDWPQAAREILASEKADFVVMMVGLADRQPIRERQVKNVPRQAGSRQPGAAAANQSSAQPAAEPPVTPPESAEQGPDAPADEAPPPSAPEPTVSGTVVHEFRSEKWDEAYAKRIDETIAVLKSKGLPVFWVGLPAIRGSRATADMVYLNELYRARAEKAGVTYVDIWDGFVDENGNFSPQGPDFEGQIRRLRSGDGVYFTKYGARKLAHYVEREIRRVMLARGAPSAMPAPEEPQPQVAAPAGRPGAPARPTAGPVVPLTNVATTGADALLGGGSGRAGASDPLVNRVLVKGEPQGGQAGRADDFAWPRGESRPPAEPEEPADEPTAPQPPDETTNKPPAARNGALAPGRPGPTPGQPAPASADRTGPATSNIRRTGASAVAARPQRPAAASTDSDAPRPPRAISGSTPVWPFGGGQR